MNRLSLLPAIRLLFAAFFLMLAAACTPAPVPAATTTPTLASSTPAPSQTPTPSSTQLPPSPTATLTPLPASAKVQINVRKGPGTEFDVLGMLSSGSALSLTGKNEAGTWFQVTYAAGADGKGWVAAAYVQVSQGDTALLPVLDASGASLTSGPTSVPLTPTPTLAPAGADNDSATAPAISVVFSPTGARQFNYTSDVSAPQGDAEDWLAFTPYASLADSPARLLFSLICAGTGDLTVELWQNGAPLSGWGELACGDRDKTIELKAGAPYLLRLRPRPGEGLRYVRYTLTVRNAE